MLQTGDPLGDGTGGESIWGSEFEDEFDESLRHDRWVVLQLLYSAWLTRIRNSRPYTLSMANAGPKTNGSQVRLWSRTALFSQLLILLAHSRSSSLPRSLHPGWMISTRESLSLYWRPSQTLTHHLILSVFGRATAGLDVIHAIEDVRCDKTDKPLEDVRMLNIEIS